MTKKQSKPNETESSNLPDERSRALEALLSAPTINAAAKLAGISRTTLWRYRRDPGFAADLKAGHDAAFAEGLSRLKGALDDAVGNLCELLASENETIRLSAAKAIIDSAVKAITNQSPVKDQPEEDRNYMRDLVEKQIGELMATRGYDRAAALAEMREWVTMPAVRKYLF